MVFHVHDSGGVRVYDGPRVVPPVPSVRAVSGDDASVHGIFRGYDAHGHAAPEGRRQLQRALTLGQIMSTPVHTIDVNAGADRAAALMADKGCHHLPVLAAGELVGVVSDRDLLRQGGMAGGLARIQVASLMSKPVISASEQASVREAASVMIGAGVNCLPILAPQSASVGALVGMVTSRGILASIVRGAPLDIWI